MVAAISGTRNETPTTRLVARASQGHVPAHDDQRDAQEPERHAGHPARGDRLPVEKPGEGHGQHRAQRHEEGSVAGRGAMHARDEEGQEQRGAEKAEQADRAPVAASERRSERSTGETHEDERDDRDCASNGGECDWREEALGRLDRGVASPPEQGDE